MALEVYFDASTGVYELCDGACCVGTAYTEEDANAFAVARDLLGFSQEMASILNQVNETMDFSHRVLRDFKESTFGMHV